MHSPALRHSSLKYDVFYWSKTREWDSGAYTNKNLTQSNVVFDECLNMPYTVCWHYIIRPKGLGYGYYS